MTELVRRDSVETLCLHRERALMLYRQGMEALKEARAAHARACPTAKYIDAPDFNLRYDRFDPEAFVAHMKPRIDRNMWSSLVEFTKIGSLMDRTERERFEAQLKQDPPEVTPETVLATFQRLGAEAETIFRRGLVVAFSRLCRDFKSNDGFKIGERIVHTYGVSWDTWGHNGTYWRLTERSEAEFRDIDRVMHVLDGQPAPEYTQGLLQAFRTAFEALRSDKNAPKLFETPYWKVRFFKNRNVHLWPKRPDLVKKANRLIADHFGEVLGASWDAKQEENTFDPEPKDYGVEDRDFFWSPMGVVSHMISVAHIERHHNILEPSAGEGQIARAALELIDKPIQMTCVEIDERRHGNLTASLRHPVHTAYPPLCFRADFLTLSAPEEPEFDRVLMNPPFCKGQDIRHVWHAFKFLKPGGRLVSIMPSGVKTNTHKNTVAFRDWVTALGGTITDLPEGSFKEAGTSVNTVMLIIDKPEAP